MASLKNTTINDTGYLQLPNGTDAQRPTAANGQMRYNTTSGQMEVYNNGWIQLSTNYNIEVLLVGGGGGGGASYNISYGGGGGGGGGGYLEVNTSVTPGTAYSLTVGGGGAGASISATAGTIGSSTTGFGYTARGGGGGASYTQGVGGGDFASGGGGARDTDGYGVPSTQDGQGNYGGGPTSGGCCGAGGGGGANDAGYEGRTDCNNWRFDLSGCGGKGRINTWTGNNAGIIATSVKGYATYGGAVSGAYYSVDYSDDQSTWTAAFTGSMDNASIPGYVGVMTGSGTGNGSYGRHLYWRYRVTGVSNRDVPRVSRIWLLDANGNEYILKRFAPDQGSDVGSYRFNVLYGKFQEGTYYGGGGGGSFEANNNTYTFGNAGLLPDRGGRGSNCYGGVVYNSDTAGVANSGNGGGGANHNWAGGASAGGSGIIIIRYYGPQRGSGGTVTSNNGYTIHTFTSSGTFTA